jgi:spore coat assembly protein
LVIFAGACQSNYEALLKAGANFASSPKRVLIHAFDPVFVVERLAYTPCHKVIALRELVQNTITGADGVGGLETRGRFRLGYPKSPY